MRVAVLGSGSWGTALSILVARNGHEVVLLGRDPEEIATLRSCRENLHYLPGFALPDLIQVKHLDEGWTGVDFTVAAVPSSGLRNVLTRPAVAASLAGRPLLIASKGLEPATARLMTEVAAELDTVSDVGVIGGPNLAVEIVRGVPTAAVVAFDDEEVALEVRQVFMCGTFRVYVSEDVVGVELAGALKNVLAIGAGMSDGLGFGDNTKGAFLARGLKESVALGLKMGARFETFIGIAGIGDLFATAASVLSRNYRVGKALGSGRGLTEILQEIGQVAEGVMTSEAVGTLMRRHDVPMPVFEAIEAVIRGRLSPARGVGMLMERTTPHEAIVIGPPA